MALENQPQENPVFKTRVKLESFVSQRHKEFHTQPDPQTWCFGKTDGPSVDLVNISISAHRSNTFNPRSIAEFLDLINCIRECVIAIVYCQRFGTQYVSEQLRSTGIPIINVKRHLLSKRKQKSNITLQKTAEFHPDKELEIKHILTVLRFKINLQKVVQKKISKN